MKDWICYEPYPGPSEYVFLSEWIGEREVRAGRMLRRDENPSDDTIVEVALPRYAITPWGKEDIAEIASFAPGQMIYNKEHQVVGVTVKILNHSDSTIFIWVMVAGSFHTTRSYVPF